MKNRNWRSLLVRRNSDVLGFLDSLPEDRLANLHQQVKQNYEKREFFETPAGSSEIESTEQRLNIRLPSEYRSFLQTSNGWRFLSLEDEPGFEVTQVSAIDRYADRHPTQYGILARTYGTYGGIRNAAGPEVLSTDGLNRCMALSTLNESNDCLVFAPLGSSMSWWQLGFHSLCSCYPSFEKMLDVAITANLEMFRNYFTE